MYVALLLSLSIFYWACYSIIKHRNVSINVELDLPQLLNQMNSDWNKEVIVGSFSLEYRKL